MPISTTPWGRPSFPECLSQVSISDSNSRLESCRASPVRSLIMLAVGTIVLFGSMDGEAQPGAADRGLEPEAGLVDRLPDGRPDLNGNWSIGVSLSDISASIVRIGDAPIESGMGTIPYTPAYARLRAETDQRLREEPELHCYMSGVPSHMWRQSYSGAGLVVQHTVDYIAFLHEFQGSRRIVPLDGRAHLDEMFRFFMGEGVGRWEGDTLVIETRNNTAITWLDLAGNRHSDQLVVTERFTPIHNDAYRYEATFVDADAYTAPWTIAALMARGDDPDAEILEFACVEGNAAVLQFDTPGGSTP
jgi:hypothetical protein